MAKIDIPIDIMPLFLAYYFIYSRFKHPTHSVIKKISSSVITLQYGAMRHLNYLLNVNTRISHLPNASICNRKNIIN